MSVSAISNVLLYLYCLGLGLLLLLLSIFRAISVVGFRGRPDKNHLDLIIYNRGV
jgi:hypothetical protein